MNKYLWSISLSVIALTACGKNDAPVAAKPAPALASAEEKILNVYNWPDYIAKDMVANFSKETGIKVNYQTFENNEALQAKLVAGNSGYDIVVPGAVFAKPQIDAGLLLKLDKSKLANYTNLDPAIMAKLGAIDPGNDYLVPWAWSFTTVAINKAKVAKALGTMPMPVNAWELVFNPLYTAKLKTCGIVLLDSPTEVIPPAMHYLGKNAYSNDPLDHQAAGAMLAKVRPDIRFFSSTMIDDLASGKACVALGWAGDINIARARAIENKNGNEVEALLPSTGGLIFFDNLAIPKDAKHPKNALAFINYFLQADVAASLTNELGYATANKASLALVKPEIAKDPTVFPDSTNLEKMLVPSSFSNAARESMSNVFTRFKKG
ncbi:Putrescine-binding periplasmic protein SpuD [Polaromonas vacuolata]|uniref:Putrescine-binding periplasmic protein n=1 Tax=Polaromonas vacuolata TaxID=37448 RepID=A0A6H2HAS0_9BURK|nr:extracellular solute-binding protein [Polaromonas vacuolata]QJC56644.1 Putrescine-binding periplasmic protein SpuD [Polaromonas vacuolata]QJC56694.1 Putrescine-binding periplasmic protein SpuD [Polaromonas vacuolata]